MKNILNEKPVENLEGRLEFSTKFTNIEDITNREMLNIGCGFGWFELYALKSGVKHISAIEISELDLKAAIESINDPRADFTVGSAINIPFNSNSFDTVVSWEVIEHIPQNTEDKMFKEVERVLKPGGTFYLSTPHKNFLSCVLDPAWWLIGHRHYSIDQLEKFGMDNDLKLVTYEIKGGIWSLIRMINLYIAKWIFHRDIFFKEVFTDKTNQEYQGDKTGLFNIFVKYVRN